MNSIIEGSLFPEMEPPQKKVMSRKKETMPGQVMNLKEENAALRLQIEALRKENSAMKSKVEAFDSLIASQSLFTTGVIAKSVGRTAVWLNKYLQQKKVQYSRGDVWMLYAKYDHCGYTRICWYNYAQDSKGNPLNRAHTYWTSKGLLFIRELLKKDGLLDD